MTNLSEAPRLKPCSEQSNNSYILYDQDIFGKIDDNWFDANHWRQRQAIIGSATGRGLAWFINAGETEMVLRHYIRGGMMRRLLRDRYFWIGLSKSRAWREWNLLALMKQKDLPVPHPVGARVIRNGLFYTADLITQRILGAESLTNRLVRGVFKPELWNAIGACLRQFHNAGIYHADLNAHNILLDRDDKVYLIDFDRGECRSAGSWQKANLKRLLHSLNKLAGIHKSFCYKEQDWQQLLQGYTGPNSS